MKFFLIITICLFNECENFQIIKTFDTKMDCRTYSVEVVEKIQNELPDSSGRTWCVNELELKIIKENLNLKDKSFEDITI